MPKAKSEALRKKREEETDNRCKVCDKPAHHPIHKDKEHPKYHKMNAEEKEEREVEKEEDKEGRE